MTLEDPDDICTNNTDECRTDNDDSTNQNDGQKSSDEPETAHPVPQAGEQQEQQQQQPSFSANVTKAINQNDGLCGGHSFFNQITNYCVYDTINVQGYESPAVRKHPGKM